MTNAPSGAARQKAGSAKPGSTKPGPPPTVSNHYVPRWYQRRFLLPGDTRLRYLDLRPERIPAAPGRKFRSNLMHWGPERCFARDHLYTIKLGRWMTDEIEHGFFRQIDEGGRVGVDFFANYRLTAEFEEAWHGLMAFMDAQRFRTPRGLDWFSKATRVDNRNALLLALDKIFQRNASMWTEAVWEVVSATNSPTKFLLTDNPVTFYNERAFPGGPMCT
jgi:hypothetical protein